MTIGSSGVIPPLFSLGDAPDAAYRNLSSDTPSPPARVCRVFAEELWERYHPYADKHFLSEIRRDFHARFWEMYLTCALLEHGPRLGYAVACHKPGPDVLLEFKDRCIWIEAITATDGDPAKPDSVGHPDPAKTGQIPDEKIVLRYTNAIDAKYRKYLEYLEKGIVAEEDSYLIAVNGYPLSYGWADPEIPRILKAVFPLGHLQFIFDRKTLKRVETKHQFRPAIFKSSGKDVSTAGFMSEQYAGISGILYSRANAYMTARPLGSDFLIAHNPMAGHPVRLGSLAADREYVAKPVDRDVYKLQCHKGVLRRYSSPIYRLLTFLRRFLPHRFLRARR